MDRTYVAIDVETTGLEAGTDEVIEIAAVKFAGDQVLETFQKLVKPRHTLPLKITRLTGITEAMLADAPRFSEVAPDLVRFVKSYPLIGHSVGFDLKMLQAQGMRFAQPAYDTFDLATLLMPHAPAYRLSTLAATLGIIHDEAHRALSDADVARQVFLRMLQRMEALDLPTLAEISRLTSKIEWPLRDLFGEVERAKAKNVFLDERRTTKDEGSAIDDRPIDYAVPELDEGQGRRPTTEAPALDNSKLKTLPLSGAKGQNSESVPLKPTGNEQPLDIDAVRHFFAPDGALGRSFAGYEQREQQVVMSETVAQAFNHGEALMVEAGTGTGKGMAYLVPAALFAAQRGERVVISTNTINLQDQLFFKDIPDLQRIMAQHLSVVRGQLSVAPGSGQGTTGNGQQATDEPPFTAALLKGRGNYLCLRRYKDLRRDGRLVSEEIKTLLKVQLWLPTTNSGDKAELLLMDKENAAWGRINVTPETCTGPRCPDFKECFYFKARRTAEAAHVIVVNHALMLADLASEANVLPPYDHIIIDEAHNLEDVATDQFGFTVDQAQLLKFLDDLFQTGGANTSAGLFAELPKYFQNSAATQGDMDKAGAIAQAAGPAVTRGRQSVYDCFNLLTAFMTQEAEATSYDARLRITDAVRKNPLWEAVEQAWENLSLQLTGIGDALGKLEALLTDLEDVDLLEYDMLLLRVQRHTDDAIRTAVGRRTARSQSVRAKINRGAHFGHHSGRRRFHLCERADWFEGTRGTVPRLAIRLPETGLCLHPERYPRAKSARLPAGARRDADRALHRHRRARIGAVHRQQRPAPDLSRHPGATGRAGHCCAWPRHRRIAAIAAGALQGVSTHSAAGHHQLLGGGRRGWRRAVGAGDCQAALQRTERPNLHRALRRFRRCI